MKTKDVFDETIKLEDELIKIQERINLLNIKRENIMKLCQHEIVFKYNDNFPKKKIIDGNYICPACGKLINCIRKEQIEKSDFKNSRVISLVNLSLIGTKEVHSIIKNEVSNNMDFYYNKEISDEELSSKMKLLLQDKQCEYNSSQMVLRKINKTDTKK